MLQQSAGHQRRPKTLELPTVPYFGSGKAHYRPLPSPIVAYLPISPVPNNGDATGLSEPVFPNLRT
jgi:hypothetical protein